MHTTPPPSLLLLLLLLLALHHARRCAQRQRLLLVLHLPVHPHGEGGGVLDHRLRLAVLLHGVGKAHNLHMRDEQQAGGWKPRGGCFITYLPGYHNILYYITAPSTHQPARCRPCTAAPLLRPPNACSRLAAWRLGWCPVHRWGRTACWMTGGPAASGGLALLLARRQPRKRVRAPRPWGCLTGGKAIAAACHHAPGPLNDAVQRGRGGSRRLQEAQTGGGYDSVHTRVFTTSSTLQQILGERALQYRHRCTLA